MFPNRVGRCGISAEHVQADIAKLVSFGTRNTLSSMDAELPAGQGINAAAAWLEADSWGEDPWW